MKRIASLFLMLCCLAAVVQAQVTLTINPDKRGAVIGDRHYGIFFEEINHAGDGGLYAELIRNRSFEDNSSLEYWQTFGGARLRRSTTNLLNDVQGGCGIITMPAKIGALVNEGFWGMNFISGEEYKLSMFVRTASDVTLRAVMLSEKGNEIGSAPISVKGSEEWQKVQATITPTSSDGKGRFAIYNAGAEEAEVAFDVVSLFPPTFKGRENGCRRDLAEMLLAMKPSFMRFPGGCYIEGEYKNGSQNRFEWKKTIGPIESRPGHLNVNWNYRVSDGLGYHEMLQLSEDLGAEPLFVVNIGLGHGWYRPYYDIDEYIQEALDALEYANGDATTKYGAMRIANGHPAPFNLRLIEIGNENYNYTSSDNRDQSDHYAERYYAFYQAIKAKYPDVTCIGNVQSWGTDNPTWRNSYPVDAVDEHYYRNPGWFVNQYSKYDKYNRATSPKVYAGEYAVTSDFGTTGNLAAALGEAVYMEGMENNSDLCIMNSYAPIFVNENDQKWMPDMIRFNSSEAYGTPSYYVQKLMPNYVGKQNVKWTETGNSMSEGKNYGGLSTWLTSAEFSNYTVTRNDGTVYNAPFDGTEGWIDNGGIWTEDGGVLIQQSTSMEGKVYLNSNFELGDSYTIELDAVKTGGKEGFLIAFNYKDKDNYVWWNLGGWNNSKHAVEVCENGAKKTVAERSGYLVTGQTYHLKIVVDGAYVECYLDGELMHSFSVPVSQQRRVYVASSINDETGKLYVKMVNPNGTMSKTDIVLRNYAATNGRLIQMKSGSNLDENTTANKYNVVPTETPFSCSGKNIPLDIPPYSFNILVLDVEESADEEDPIEPGADLTSEIANPSFEAGLNGWTNDGMQPQDNTEPKAQKVGSLYCEKWTDANKGVLLSAGISQTVQNLPIGLYRLTAACHAENQRTGAEPKGVFLYANDAEAEVSDAREYSVDFNVLDGTAEIGFRVDGTNCNWVTVDNFRLTYLSADVDISISKEKLASEMARLSTLLDTKKILPADSVAKARTAMAAWSAAEGIEGINLAIKECQAMYAGLLAFRITVDRSNEGYAGYLFAYFPSNNNENLYYAYSEDGFNYTVLNNGQRVMASDTVAIKKGIRDPHLIRGVDGRTFYMVATDMMSAEGWASNRGIVMYKSRDLIHWTHSTVHFPTRFPNGWSSVTRVWAPEIIWDPEYVNADGSKGRYMIYFSLLTSDDGTCNYDKVYYCYANDDFTDLLDYPQFFYDRGSSTIDADIVYDEGDQLYHMIYKNEGSGGIMHVTAETLTPKDGMEPGSQWSRPTGFVQQTSVAVEGGGIFRTIADNQWVVMYDCYGSGYYQFCTTTDWKKYTLRAQTTMSGMFTPRHGSVTPITPCEFNTLLDAFPTAGLGKYLVGDVNSDGVVDMRDAVMTTDRFLGKPVGNFNRRVADANNDRTISISDSNAIVNIR